MREINYGQGKQFYLRLCWRARELMWWEREQLIGGTGKRPRRYIFVIS
jgi:hypothetical protein